MSVHACEARMVLGFSEEEGQGNMMMVLLGGSAIAAVFCF